MKYKYQLIILGNIGNLSNKVIELFFIKIKELKLDREYFKIINHSNFHTEYSGNQPAFAIYFGNKEGNFKDIEITTVLLKDGTMILPVYYTDKCFNNEIPKILENQNGLLYDSTKDIKIVNLALEAFELLRSSRKIFVSYKRSESTSVAIQLYEELERNNFDVFLDTHSIKQGEPFQEELWHRMTDCDVIVLLNTPKFLESYWCKEEIAEASAKQIGIIQLVWPNHKLEAMAHVCTLLQLKADDFENKEIYKLKKSFVNDLIFEAESMRARNLASRQDNLITEFSNFALKHGKKINIQPERFITEELDNNKRRIFIPSVGIPQSINCNQSEEIIKEIKDFEIDSVYLIYDDLRIRDKWLNHLDWLNRYLKVQTIKKKNFDKWLEKN
ncbi:toll/interleukin-1 receptor domain-containing protein [Tenacibaculum finnmarkense]|uniref:toll/interleukin-1 receptor domain-containing protein n=1 Tax=Tenacibaculum finnmarkense TaxID=2781243 RepID=UPI001EFB434E|nr:toll/interleukin-1 receptor domain-containing protein [Tenacibaculum finnmarkense]MCG8795921.1 toll/interleukin-1 receptor domain-containing protein [Tenacibaculum finnmarkense]MCG8798088.1 toll/interleukin-1 receptor domain-containing protein [Tenacibaculum finnmarkense]